MDSDPDPQYLTCVQVVIINHGLLVTTIVKGKGKRYKLKENEVYE